MWFDPVQLTKTAEPQSATLATSATPTRSPTVNDERVARIAEVAIGEASHRWLLHFADRESLEVCCNPDATHAEILKRHPDALAAEPLPERIRRTPTEAEATELRALVQAIGAAEKWPVDEIEWSTDGALADPDGALICYRALAVEYGIILPLDDDRCTCNQCVKLVGRRCLAAWRAEIVANRDYEPIRDIPRRCEGYMPVAGDPDRRPGNERWPGLTEKEGDHE